MILEIKNLNKSFADHHVLQDVSFTITSGKAMGFLGRNGAGKTTTIRSLMDVFKADSGEFLLDGNPSTQTITELDTFQKNVDSTVKKKYYTNSSTSLPLEVQNQKLPKRVQNIG